MYVCPTYVKRSRSLSKYRTYPANNSRQISVSFNIIVYNIVHICTYMFMYVHTHSLYVNAAGCYRTSIILCI